jgi:hypothetical protein
MKNEFETIVAKSLENLFYERFIFHSEADFQHALAMKIAENKNIKIRLEKPCKINNKAIKIDIELTDENEKKYAIELKYKTKKLNCEHAGENFDLKTQGAHNLGRYDFWKDCERIINLENFCGGCVIFLTNDDSYKKQELNDCMSKNFAIKNNVTTSENLQLGWEGEPNEKSVGKIRKSNIVLENKISLGDWKQFDIQKNEPNKIFYYIIAKI